MVPSVASPTLPIRLTARDPCAPQTDTRCHSSSDCDLELPPLRGLRQRQALNVGLDGTKFGRPIRTRNKLRQGQGLLLAGCHFHRLIRLTYECQSFILQPLTIDGPKSRQMAAGKSVRQLIHAPSRLNDDFASRRRLENIIPLHEWRFGLLFYPEQNRCYALSAWGTPTGCKTC